MTLRKKTLLTVVFLFISLIAIFFFVSHSILSGNFARQEQHEVSEDVERVISALDTELSNLQTTAMDWAEWDDTYTFVQDNNPEYQESNLGLDTFLGLRLNLFIITDSTGKVIFSKTINLDDREEVTLPEGINKYIYDNAPVVNHTDIKDSISGFILLSEGPMVLASNPILTSKGEGPIRGTLIMGRFIQQSDIVRLAKIPWYLLPYSR